MRWGGFLVLSLIACGGRPPAGADETSSGEGDASSGDVTSDDDSSTTAPTSEGPEAGTTEMGPCESNGDCPPGMLCLHGECQLDCGETRVSIDIPPPHVLWVLDRSRSMAALTWDHDDDPTTAAEPRWRQAANFVGGVSTPLEEQMHEGIVLFPGDMACSGLPSDCVDSSACAMDDSLAVSWSEEPGLNAIEISSALQTQFFNLAGGSPATTALELARAEMNDLAAQGESRLRVVLITDGALNCEEQACESPDNCPLLTQMDTATEDLLAQMYQDGLEVYVVGVDARNDDPSGVANDDPQGSRLDHLNALAIASGLPKPGGTESFWHGDEPELLVDLWEPSPRPGSCSITLDETPQENQLDLIEVYIGPNDQDHVPYMPNLSAQECVQEGVYGWTWDEPGQDLLFCHDACEALNEYLELRAIYGCPDS